MPRSPLGTLPRTPPAELWPRRPEEEIAVLAQEQLELLEQSLERKVSREVSRGPGEDSLQVRGWRLPVYLAAVTEPSSDHRLQGWEGVKA